MNRKIALFSLTIIILLFVVGCTPYIPEKPTTTTTLGYLNPYTGDDEVLKSCYGIEDIYQRESCFREWGKSQTDIEFCDSIKDEEHSDFCYWGVAEKVVNPSICRFISEECDILHSPHAPNCKFTCYESLIEMNTDPRNCDEIDNTFRFYCLYEFENEELFIEDCEKGGTFTYDQRYSQNDCERKYASRNNVGTM